MVDEKINENERLLLPEEVAGKLNVAVSWVYRAARDGQLPSVRVGRWVRFRGAELDAWIASGGTGGN